MTPPIGVRFFPEQPVFSRFLSQQILARESLRHRKSLRALAHQHHMTGMLANRIRNQRDILDVANPTNRACRTRWTMHAAGIEFDHTFFVGPAPESDVLVIRIVFRPLNDLNRRVECVRAACQEFVAFLNPVVAVLRANKDWEFGCTFGFRIRILCKCRSEAVQGDRTSNG